MSLKKNMSPQEIEDYINKPRKGSFPWRELLEGSFVPEDILVKYLNKMFNGDYQQRAAQIIYMYKRHNHVISTDTMFALFNKYKEFAELKDVGYIIDLNQYCNKFSDEEFADRDNDYIEIILYHVQRDPNNLSAELLKRVLSVYPKSCEYWHKETYEQLSPECKEVLKEVYTLDIINDQYQPEKYFHFYSTKEVLENIELTKLINGLTGNSFSNVIDNRTVRDEIKNTPELMDLFIGKVLDTDNETLLRIDAKSFMLHMMKDHPRRDEVLDHCITIMERIQNIPSTDIDWQDVDSNLQDMSIEERSAWFSREDVPVWFLNANAGVLLHLQMQEQNQALKEQQFFINAMTTVPRLGGYSTFFE